MKVLIYYNKEKDFEGACKTKLVECLETNGISYDILGDDMINSSIVADALFAIGGDGTLLYLAKFAIMNNIPIIGINAGRLGFLCEFEKSCIEDAVLGLKNSQFIKDERTMISLQYNNVTYYALNEIHIQRIYGNNEGNIVAGIDVEIENEFVSKYIADGIIVSTPTGSTAYSFSLGAPILAPYSNVLLLTPIASHSFNQRPIIYPYTSNCKMSITTKSKVGVFVDGKLVDYMNQNDCINIKKIDKKLIFLRRNNFNFFKKLSYKLYKSIGENKND